MRIGSYLLVIVSEDFWEEGVILHGIRIIVTPSNVLVSEIIITYPSG